MGVQPSKTELYLPSQTLRECHPDRCWCDRPYHRSSRYVYVERGGDGRERYQDPVDIMSQVMGGGMPPQMPWKDPRSWTVRDYEKLSEVMEEWATRENGKSSGPRGGGFPNWPGMQQQQGGGGYWDGGDGSSGGGGRHRSSRSRRYVPWDQFEDLKSNMQHMAEQYQRHMSEQDAFLFGSDTDRRKEQYRQNMLKQLQEMLPQLVQMMSGGNGQQGQAMPGMQQQPQMMPGMPMPMPGMQMPQMQNPMQAMNGMAGINPMAAAAAMQNMTGMGMPPQMMNPMMNSGMMPGMMGNGGGMEAPQNMSRRARRRNGFAIDDGFDEDYDDIRPRRGFNKRRGGGGGGGNWRDDDDMLGGFGGNGMHGPRGGPPSRPGPTFRPNGGFDGGSGGGMAFDEQHTDPFRPTPGHPATRPQHDDFPSSCGAGASAQQRFSPPLRRPNYTANDMAAATEMRHQQQQQQNMMSGTNPFAASGYNGMSQAGHDPNLYDSSGAAGFNNSSGAGYTPVATAGPSNLRSAMKHNVAFQDVSGTGTESAHLTRPREEETTRGEANAGAMPDKRDGLGTL